MPHVVHIIVGMVLMERRYKGILKAASLFECHLNVDSVSLESEGANQSLVLAKHSLTNTQQV